MYVFMMGPEQDKGTPFVVANVDFGVRGVNTAETEVEQELPIQILSRSREWNQERRRTILQLMMM